MVQEAGSVGRGWPASFMCVPGYQHREALETSVQSAAVRRRPIAWW